MLGGLHVEMASLKVLGNWLTGTGWAEALCSAGVVTQDVADSLLTASHLSRTRRAHQITVMYLCTLMCRAYQKHASSRDENEAVKIFHDSTDKSSKCRQFLYWANVLELELCCLQPVRTFREANVSLYVKARRKILPGMFAMDRPNYARGLSMHYRDMCVLPNKHPDMYNQFRNNNFVVHKTKRFCDSTVKGEGGAVDSLKILQRFEDGLLLGQSCQEW